MIHHIPRIAMFLVFALTVGAGSAAAQTPTTGATPNISELEGIQGAVSRTWGIDFEAVIAATPNPAQAELNQGVTALSALVMKFESDANAQGAFDAFQEGIGAQLLVMGQGGTPTVSGEEISDLGDQAAATTLNTKSADQETFFRFVLVREGAFVYLTSALAGTSEEAAIADDLATFVTDEGEEQGDAAIFVGKGGSSGGLWGFMPAADHEVLGGLIPIMDETIFPAS